MCLKVALLLAALAAFAWGRVAVDRLSGGGRPAPAVADLIGLPEPPGEWGWVHDAMVAAGGLEAGTALLLAALALLIVDALLGRRN